MSGTDLGLPWVANPGRQFELVAVAELDVSDFLVVSPATAAKVVSGSLYKLVELPSNAIVTSGSIIVTTAFDPAGAMTIDLGDTTTAARYADDVSLKTAATTALTGVPFVNTTGLDANFTVTIASGTPTVGHAIVIVRYVIRGRSHERA